MKSRPPRPLPRKPPFAVAAMRTVSPAGLNAPPTLVHFDIPVMIAVCAACLPIFFSGYCINRWEGALFFAYYLLYTAYVLLAAMRNDALGVFSFAMSAFVLPLTAVTLIVIGYQALRARR